MATHYLRLARIDARGKIKEHTKMAGNTSMVALRMVFALPYR